MVAKINELCGSKCLRHTIDINVMSPNMDRNNCVSLTEPAEEVMLLDDVAGQARDRWGDA